MTFQEFLVKIGLSEFSFWGIMLFLASLGVELTPKIKWNPWTSLFKWIGSKFNTHIDAKLDVVRGELDTKLDAVRGEIRVIDIKVDNVRDELAKHKTESEMKTISDTRRDILDFANACMNGRKHTQEQYKYMLKKCDYYTSYVKANHIENGEIENAIDEIKRLHKDRLHKNDFLKEGEDPEEHIRKSIIDEVIQEFHRLYDACPGRAIVAKPAMRAKPKKKSFLIDEDEHEEGEAEA